MTEACLTTCAGIAIEVAAAGAEEDLTHVIVAAFT